MMPGQAGKSKVALTFNNLINIYHEVRCILMIPYVTM